jgi:hypothetical protein
MSKAFFNLRNFIELIAIVSLFSFQTIAKRSDFVFVAIREEKKTLFSALNLNLGSKIKKNLLIVVRGAL